MSPALRQVPAPVTVPRKIKRRAAGIEVLLLDVDGVMTDGAIVIDNRGVETKSFHVRDGSAVKLWQAAGKHVGIVTGRRSRVVDVRAAELSIELVHQGVKDKLQVMEELLVRLGLKSTQACFVGDDLADLPTLSRAGLAVAVADACPEVRDAAHYVTRTGGGRGAVREVVELLLKAQGRWRQLQTRFR